MGEEDPVSVFKEIAVVGWTKESNHIWCVVCAVLKVSMGCWDN
jgi:hypothetical protein